MCFYTTVVSTIEENENIYFNHTDLYLDLHHILHLGRFNMGQTTILKALVLSRKKKKMMTLLNLLMIELVDVWDGTRYQCSIAQLLFHSLWLQMTSYSPLLSHFYWGYFYFIFERRNVYKLVLVMCDPLYE